jgi:hypothetical protein
MILDGFNMIIYIYNNNNNYEKNITLMYFQLKHTFKKYLYHTIKHTFNFDQFDWLVREI